MFDCGSEFLLKPRNPPLKRHALSVAAVSPLHGIPLITLWPSPENLNQHRLLVNTGVRLMFTSFLIIIS